MTLATVGAVVGIASGVNSIYQSSKAGKAGGGGVGGGGNADPFAAHRGQFGDMLSSLFTKKPKLGPDGQPLLNPDGTPQYDESGPSWLTPGMGVNNGSSLMPGQGMADSSLLNFDPQAIQNDPAYQFQLKQGNNGINASRAAGGELDSGGTLAALSDFNQGLATNFTNQQFNRNLQRYNSTNSAQAQGFGQLFSQLGFGNQAQNQTFQQGNQYSDLLGRLSGAFVNPADASRANTAANANAYGQQKDQFGNIISGLGYLGKTFFPPTIGTSGNTTANGPGNSGGGLPTGP